MIEVKHEGTLCVLYVGDEAREFWTMHSVVQRTHLLAKGASIVDKLYREDCKNRGILRQSPATYDSFVRGTAGPNLRDYILFDGSKTHPIMWPELCLPLNNLREQG